MAIQIRDSDELKRLIEALAFEFVDANIAFKMHMDLISAYEGEYRETMGEAWTFWSLTIQSHIDSAIFRLCRIYDQKTTNLGLRGLLDTIKSNQHMFSREQFSIRMLNRPQPELLIASFDPLDPAQIDVDMDYATRDTNPVVDRLIAVRHNYYSHRNARDVVADRSVAETYPHQRNEVGELLNNGLTIVNRYGTLFDMNTWSKNIIGGTDYHYVLRAAKERLDRLLAQRGF